MTARTIAATTIAAALVLAAGSAAAGDSTTAPHPAVPWQAPNARSLGGVSSCPTGQVVSWNGSAWACTNTIANAGNATYANTAGETGWASNAGNANSAGVAGSAGYANNAGGAGYANSAGATGWADNANYANTAGWANGSAGAAANCPAGVIYPYGIQDSWYNIGVPSASNGTVINTAYGCYGGYYIACISGTWAITGLVPSCRE